jgi:hypothetical protein
MTHLDNVGPVTHQLPPYGMDPLPCCGRSWKAVPPRDRFSAVADHVDCRGLEPKRHPHHAAALHRQPTGCAPAAMVGACAAAIVVVGVLLWAGWWGLL